MPVRRDGNIWRMDGYPLVGQDSACAIVNNCSQSVRQALVATNHTAGKRHHGMLPYAGWNHTDPAV